MRSAGLSPDGTLRDAGAPNTRTHADHDPAGLRPTVPGDGRGAVRPGLARLGGVVPPAGRAQPLAGPVPGGGLGAPGAGRADGRTVGPPGGSQLADRPGAGAPIGARIEPAFDIAVAPGGYAWWYLDALSDDGEHGLTIIAFIGSVFSPYYAHARRRSAAGGADPLNHCAMNIALYGRGGNRWAMTERGRGQLQRDDRTLQIGPSAMRWVGDALHIEIDEIAVPWPTRIRGSVTLHAPRRFHHPVELAPQHRWCPIAPAARVDVDLGALNWSGPGYLDSNQGDAPLESAFRRWDWSRAQLSGGRSVVLYDVERVDASPLQLGLCFDASGGVHDIQPPPRTALPTTLWRLARGARGDVHTPVRLMRTLTDAPFYARSLVNAQWLGERVTAMHESLSLARFDTVWVQAMLPFRMPRLTNNRRAGAGPDV